MMRTSFAVLALLLGSIISTARAADIAPADKEFFEKNLNKIVKLTPKQVNQPALAKVTSIKLYQVEVQIGELSTTMLMARNGDKLINISSPSTSSDLPELKAIFDPKFKLLNDADAKVLEAAIDVLYPMDKFGGPEEAKAKAIRHKGNEWIFVRGKFFKDEKGYVFTTDAKGTITQVRYSLELPNK